MAGSWDGNLKRLVQEAPQDFVDWLLKGALFEDELSPHLQHRQVDADLLYRLRFGHHPLLLHLEFQRRSDPLMARRLWEYNVLATCKFDCPVYSFVLYLKKMVRWPTPPIRCACMMVACFTTSISESSSSGRCPAPHYWRRVCRGCCPCCRSAGKASVGRPLTP